MPATSLRSTTRPIVQAVCSISRQLSESSRGGVGVVTLRSSFMSAGRCANRQVSRACTGQVLKSIVKSMCAWALARAQSSVALSRLNRSEPSTMTRADLSCGFRAMPRAWVSRARSASTLCITSSSCSTSCDWRTRPEAKRVSCWPIMPTWRACSTSSRRARRPARSILPVAVRTWMRSSAAVSGAGDLGADLGDELMPSLVGRRRHGIGLDDFARKRSAGLRASKADRHGSFGARTPARPGRLESDPSEACGAGGPGRFHRVAFRREVSAPAPQGARP